jgi:hypothetical protein
MSEPMVLTNTHDFLRLYRLALAGHERGGGIGPAHRVDGRQDDDGRHHGQQAR